jgi:hypothetical protein
MRFSKLSRILAALVLAVGSESVATAQMPDDVRTAKRPTLPTAQVAPKFRFILFWNQDDTTSQQMAETLRLAAAKRPQRIEWSAVNVSDPAQRETVDRYQVARAPMPLVLCVAPNGAIAGAFVRKLDDAMVERALITPAMAEATKALQEQKIVLVHVKPAADSPLSPGAVELISDPAFQARTVVVDVVVGDPVESRFVTDMKIKPSDVIEPMLVVMAPPAVLVGKFPSQATGAQLASALHAAGKCCNDPNCKHNQKARQ